jgi:hypothetical protein
MLNFKSKSQKNSKMKDIKSPLYLKLRNYCIISFALFWSVSLSSGCNTDCSDMLGEKITATSTQVCIKYEDVDGMTKMGKRTISVERDGDECEFHLEYQFDGLSDWYVHEIKGDDGTPFERFVDPDCKRPQFDQSAGTFFEAQTAFYWVMTARDYAMSNLWKTPDYWQGGTPDLNKNDLSVNILTGGNDSDFSNACWGTEGNPGGCFRAWPDWLGGITINLRAGSVNPELVIHEYGHYAAGFVFGHTPNDMFDFRLGWIAECYKRSFNEALAEIFLHLFFHSKRYEHFDSIGAIASNEPSSSFDLGTSAVWGDPSLACDLPNANDYSEGMPLVQAVHETLWDPIWTDHREANRFMVQAFSNALLRNSGTFDLELLAKDMLKYINRSPIDDIVKLRVNDIFKLHGFETPLEIIDFDFKAVNESDNEYYRNQGYYKLKCTDEHMQYSDVKFFKPIIKLDRPAPTGINMTCIIYTEYTFDDPKTGIFTLRFEKDDIEPSGISLSNNISEVNALLDQDIQRMPVGAPELETRGFWLGCTKNCIVRGNGKKSHGSDLKVYLKVIEYIPDNPLALIIPDKSVSRQVKCIN